MYYEIYFIYRHSINVVNYNVKEDATSIGVKL